MNFRSLRTPLLIGFFSLVVSFGMAQPGGGKPCPKPPCPPPVPITGIEVLIGGGLLFGLKKLVSSRKKEK